VEVRLGHYGPGMDLRQAVVVVVVAVHTAAGVGEDSQADGGVTAVWWRQVVRSTAVAVVERRAQQVDRTGAAVLGVDMGLDVN
jgi:hypothetical protein